MEEQQTCRSIRTTSEMHENRKTGNEMEPSEDSYIMRTPVMQHDYVQPRYFKYRQGEVKGMQMQVKLGKVSARQNCSDCVAWTAGLRLALWLVFLLWKAIAGRCCLYENGAIASRVEAVAHHEDGFAALVLRSARSLCRKKDGFAAHELCGVDLVFVCVAPEWQLWRCSLAVVGYVDRATARA